MTTLADTIDAIMASNQAMDIGSQHRLQFWQEQLGTKGLTDIVPEDVDDALDVLVARGRLRAGRGLKTSTSGKPLAPSTLTRYVATLGGVYRYAKRMRLVRKSHVSPTRGVETHASPVDRNKFLTPDEVDRLIKVARVTDRRCYWAEVSSFARSGEASINHDLHCLRPTRSATHTASFTSNQSLATTVS